MKNNVLKRVLIIMLIMAIANIPIACGNGKENLIESQTTEIESVDYDSEISSDVGLICKYEMNADGTWSAGGNNYKYKLQLTGRLPNSSADITYVVLSNTTLLSFETVSKSFLSSSSTDWLDAKKACVVQIITE